MAADVVIFSELKRCRPWIEAALERQRLYSFRDVVELVMERRAQLWPGEASAMVTQLEDYPRGRRVIQSWLAGGDLGEIVDRQRPQIEDQARAWGCHAAMIEGGRKGWDRELRGHGYDFCGVTLFKELSP